MGGTADTAHPASEPPSGDYHAETMRRLALIVTQWFCGTIAVIAVAALVTGKEMTVVMAIVSPLAAIVAAVTSYFFPRGGGA